MRSGSRWSLSVRSDLGASPSGQWPEHRCSACTERQVGDSRSTPAPWAFMPHLLASLVPGARLPSRQLSFSWPIPGAVRGRNSRLGQVRSLSARFQQCGKYGVSTRGPAGTIARPARQGIGQASKAKPETRATRRIACIVESARQTRQNALQATPARRARPKPNATLRTRHKAKGEGEKVECQRTSRAYTRV